jgi:hypothetical protein
VQAREHAEVVRGRANGGRRGHAQLLPALHGHVVLVLVIYFINLLGDTQSQKTSRSRTWAGWRSAMCRMGQRAIQSRLQCRNTSGELEVEEFTHVCAA